MPYKIHAYGLTDVGHVRDNNEDFWAELSERHFYVLADGMGGHRAGEVAAEEAVNAICDQINAMFDTNAPELTYEEAFGALHIAIEETNKKVYAKGQSSAELNGMGTTLCALLFHPKGLIYAHVGDSRIYRVREGMLDQLTRDHSLLRELVERGQANNHREDSKRIKNIITKAIGTEPQVDPAVHMAEIAEGDLYLMCTDGLSDMLKDSEIEAIMGRDEPIKLLAHRLVDSAKAKGGHDNITAVIVHVQKV